MLVSKIKYAQISGYDRHKKNSLTVKEKTSCKMITGKGVPGNRKCETAATTKSHNAEVWNIYSIFYRGIEERGRRKILIMIIIIIKGMNDKYSGGSVLIINTSKSIKGILCASP